jgi:hypothetical protein
VQTSATKSPLRANEAAKRSLLLIFGAFSEFTFYLFLEIIAF